MFALELSRRDHTYVFSPIEELKQKSPEDIVYVTLVQFKFRSQVWTSYCH